MQQYIEINKELSPPNSRFTLQLLAITCTRLSLTGRPLSLAADLPKPFIGPSMKYLGNICSWNLMVLTARLSAYWIAQLYVTLMPPVNIREYHVATLQPSRGYTIDIEIIAAGKNRAYWGLDANVLEIRRMYKRWWR